MKDVNVDNLMVSGRFFIEQVRDGKVIDKWDVSNDVTVEGRRHLLSACFANDTQITPWYIGIYAGNISPDEAWLAATVSANSTEINTKYDEATREEFIEGLHASLASISNSADNGGTIATFTFNDAETVRGAFLISSAAKNGSADASATLMSIANFASRTVAASDSLNITYEISTSTV